MLAALTAIFVCQLAGEMITVGLSLSLPGPVIGMALLFLFLLVKGSVPTAIGKAGDGLLQHLSLLFVPAGAGIMAAGAGVSGHVPALALSLAGSTLLTLAVTAYVMRAALKHSRADAPGTDV